MGGQQSKSKLREQESEWIKFKTETENSFKSREDHLAEIEKSIIRKKKEVDEASDVIMMITKKREQVIKYKPGSSMKGSKLEFPDILNIGLFGTVGVGKSSLLNSLKYAIHGELDDIDREQVAPSDFQGGHTMLRIPVRLTDHITVIDNRGVKVEEIRAPGSTEEMIRQMEGKGSFARPVSWGNAGSNENVSRRKQRIEDRIHCAVLVFDARLAKSYFDVAKGFVDCLRTWQGRFPIAVVTHIDHAKDEDLKNMAMVLATTGILDVYRVSNITPINKHLDVKYQQELLSMIEKCVGDGDRIFEYRSQVEQEKREEEEIKEEGIAI